MSTPARASVMMQHCSALCEGLCSVLWCGQQSGYTYMHVAAVCRWDCGPRVHSGHSVAMYWHPSATPALRR